MSENKSTITSTGTRKFVTIKIETDMLADMFNDKNEPYYKVKNKLGFACAVRKAIVEHLTNEGLDTVMETIADDYEPWIKCGCDDEE